MIGIAGGGAFGTALAIALAGDGREVRLWARDPDQLIATRESPRLPGCPLPENVTVVADARELSGSVAVLLAVPMQALNGFLHEHGTSLGEVPLVACCKGVDLERLTGPSAIIAARCPEAIPAVLTGPSFAADIARGLPTALTLACAGGAAPALQETLSVATLRLYLTDDLAGAELGGALKNVIAIACGAVMGAGLGESARAAVMTRGFAEMTRLATVLGARAETLAGLSGLGDLMLTCSSAQSRNYGHGIMLGSGRAPDPTRTVEGVATARAVTRLAAKRQIDMPLTAVVAALVAGHTTMDEALARLMTRPLKQE